MSTAYRCDRCKGFEPDKPPATVSVKPERGTSESHDLCPKCLVGRADWLGAYDQEADRV